MQTQQPFDNTPMASSSSRSGMRTQDTVQNDREHLRGFLKQVYTAPFTALDTWYAQWMTDAAMKEQPIMAALSTAGAYGGGSMPAVSLTAAIMDKASLNELDDFGQTLPSVLASVMTPTSRQETVASVVKECVLTVLTSLSDVRGMSPAWLVAEAVTVHALSEVASAISVAISKPIPVYIERLSGTLRSAPRGI